jgi:hypothetical protein
MRLTARGPARPTPMPRFDFFSSAVIYLFTLLITYRINFKYLILVSFSYSPFATARAGADFDEDLAVTRHSRLVTPVPEVII